MRLLGIASLGLSAAMVFMLTCGLSVPSAPPTVPTAETPPNSARSSPDRGTIRLEPPKISADVAPEGSAPQALPAQPRWGRADLDPDNDGVVQPPDAVPECHGRLTKAGAKFRPAKLPLKQRVRDVPTCGANDAVIYSAGPLGVKLSPPAIVTCQLALGLVAFEAAALEFSEKTLGAPIRSIRQGGTYSCRKMARFDLVSEHSYGNAIDIYSFTLDDGRTVSVLKHFGPVDAPPKTPKATFLRSLAQAAYDRDLFSVVLTPFWDALHRDHFHFDMARYRADGTR